ncbi:ubiquitin-like-conjugating enzyme ATG10 [Sipha flava]|uniref:Ubiquitin-like-conjugating enzyme ATG10 n=1 Tax=Sipha flava TaxID=143950 RepID=A0A2S2QB34_9HEMI|nr:ubiquitin-like-conjugating enzyme ATG10 [Sipha flava]
MSMTYDQFMEYALDFKNHSDSIDDGWNIHEYKNQMTGSIIKYLVKKEMQKMNKFLANPHNSEFHLEEDSETIICEYHVLYNPSYSSPDMFFNMWFTNGKLLSIEHIWSRVHSFVKQQVNNDKWNAITQKEHPLSGIPFFRVHPCKNTHILDNLGVSSVKTFEFNPLTTWLSTISSLVGLEMHLSYGHKNIVSYN